MEGLFSNIVSILAALLLLSFFVAVHELGHFLVARRLGFTVLEYAIGMGPIVWSKKKNGILYSLRAFPVGGLCRFYDALEDNTPPPEGGPAVSFTEQKVWKRFLVTLAGPVMNVLLALVLAAGILMAYGQYHTQVRIMELTEEAPAAQAGMQPGDILLAVEGTPVTNNENAVAAILAAPGDEMTVTIQRGDGEPMELLIQNAFDPEAGKNLLGVTVQAEYFRHRIGVFPAIGASFEYVWSLIRAMFQFLGSIFTEGVQQGDVMGPAGTVYVISTAVRSGLEVVLELAVLISVNLGVMNLLPIPGLDGGRIVFLIIEAIRGKAIPPEKEGMVHFAGFVLLFGLVIFLTFSDIQLLAGR